MRFAAAIVIKIRGFLVLCGVSAQALVQQLKPGGSMVIPVGRRSSLLWDAGQVLTRIHKDLQGKVHASELMGVRYVPLVKTGRRHEF